MAYYDEGKHKFSTLIDECTLEVSKAYLKAKLEDWFGEKDGYIEQWLYNESLPEIKSELRGFIKGYLGKKYCDVDTIICHRELLPKLSKIYIEMNVENNWGNTKELEDWREINKFYENYQK